MKSSQLARKPEDPMRVQRPGAHRRARYKCVSKLMSLCLEAEEPAQRPGGSGSKIKRHGEEWISSTGKLMVDSCERKDGLHASAHQYYTNMLVGVTPLGVCLSSSVCPLYVNHPQTQCLLIC